MRKNYSTTGATTGAAIGEPQNRLHSNLMKKHHRSIRVCFMAGLAACLCGCQVLTYTGPNGERFVRTTLGTSSAISSLTVEADTNGVRRVELHGYTNDSTQALGTVTEAAVRAAMAAR
jgi:hypothetical protein